MQTNQSIQAAALHHGRGGDAGVGRRTLLGGAAKLGAAGGLGALAMACGPLKSGPGLEAPSAKALSAKITYFSREGVDQRQLDEQVVGGFIAEHPTIKVELVMTSKYEDDVVTQAAAGTSPDVGFGKISYNVAFYLKKINRSLTPFIAKDKSFKRADYDAYWLDVFDWRGQLVAVPLDPAMIVTYYNKTLIDKAGLKYPGAGTPMTWDEVLVAAKKLTVDAAGRAAAGTGMDPSQIVQAGLEWTLFGHEWYAMARLFDQEPFDKSFTKLNEEGAIQALQFLGDLRTKHLVSLPPGYPAKEPIGFARGNVALKMFGTWDIKTWRKTPGDVWDAAPLPYVQGKRRVGLGWGSGLELFAGSKAPDAAWELFKYQIGAKGQEIYVRGGLGQPMLKAMASSPAFTKSNPPYHTEVLLNETKYAKAPIHSHPAYNDMKAIMGKAVDAVYKGEKSAAQAVREVAPSINSTLVDWARRIEEMSR